MPDKFAATWVSYSSIKDFLACPRAYYLNNVYKDPQTGRKMTLMSPSLALGQAVHEVVESLSVLPTKERFKLPLRQAYEAVFKKVAGRRGGFENQEQEERFFNQGLEMLTYLEANPGPLTNLAVKIKMELPHYWLSPEDEIILCGRIDWLEYFPDSDSVHIIDFKTGKREENGDSLQLPIYTLLTTNVQKRPVTKASYWYLRLQLPPQEKPLPDLEVSAQKVLGVAKQIKLARKLGRFTCPTNGCRACLPLEAVLAGEAEYVGINDIGQDIYVPRNSAAEAAPTDTSVVL